MVMLSLNLPDSLQNLSKDALEADVRHQFVMPALLGALGFSQNEVLSDYNTGDGQVDHAARKNRKDDIFSQTKSDPHLIIELKNRSIDLSNGSTQYKRTLNQLKKYLLAPACKKTKFGLITNGTHLQLFRKHGKVIYPASTCYRITPENIEEIALDIHNKIHFPTRALTVAVYNNKGGVGKTTTVVNLAAALTLFGKRVLVIDFDPNQCDLTSSLGLPINDKGIFQCLDNRRLNAKDFISNYAITAKNGRELGFDVFSADKVLVETNEDNIRNRFGTDRLATVLEPLKSEYDYILIDSPPNWRFFSQSAVRASDVVLIPVKHNNAFSIKNAAFTIKESIPEMQKVRQDGGPIALHVFYNGEKKTDSSVIMAQKAINQIIKKHQAEGFDLLPYFYPKLTKANNNFDIPEIPGHAHIANAVFLKTPATYRFQAALESYKALAKEYFIHE